MFMRSVSRASRESDRARTAGLDNEHVEHGVHKRERVGMGSQETFSVVEMTISAHIHEALRSQLDYTRYELWANGLYTEASTALIFLHILLVIKVRQSPPYRRQGYTLVWDGLSPLWSRKNATYPQSVGLWTYISRHYMVLHFIMISRDAAAGSGFGSGLRIVHSARVDVGAFQFAALHRVLRG
ncbi:uncharacterized protein F5147DRAFT_664583 [Suillus discolor]|uniref:Uncharacterized protein n=1 Tax=Suillus discolor TaxID=1912936 RepID=A0A9P7K0A6_9AGAM|nr:uncharacterized protein F5147DRAFT_664583 [Suillus discolor]KAG2119554.1 hypothetical protein F5147DRAFT_664583 [Suillus discolor]